MEILPILTINQMMTAKDGITYAINHKPDLIFLDIDLPGEDGYQALGELKQHPDTRTIPVVMLTGLATSETVKKAVTLGAADYIVKPVDKQILTTKVTKMLKIGLTDISQHQSESGGTKMNFTLLVIDDNPKLLGLLMVMLKSTYIIESL